MSAQPITVRVKTEYLKHQSNPEAKQYVFAYHISVHNQGDAPVQLISRHWIITDSNGLKQEVRGAGVIGKQPTILPDETYEYSSGSVLATAVGTIQWSYQMLDADGQSFEAPIAPFLLSVPHAVH